MVLLLQERIVKLTRRALYLVMTIHSGGVAHLEEDYAEPTRIYYTQTLSLTSGSHMYLKPPQPSFIS